MTTITSSAWGTTLSSYRFHLSRDTVKCWITWEGVMAPDQVLRSNSASISG